MPLKPGFLVFKLKSSLAKFSDHHHYFVNHNRMSVLQMTSGMFHLSVTIPSLFPLMTWAPDWIPVVQSLIFCIVYFQWFFVFFLAHLTQRVRVRWAIVTIERPSSVVRPFVNFSHFKQLLWCHWANLNQTLVEWSLNGPLPKLCPVFLTSNQDGRQAKNRKKGGWKFNCPLLL